MLKINRNTKVDLLKSELELLKNDINYFQEKIYLASKIPKDKFNVKN